MSEPCSPTCKGWDYFNEDQYVGTGDTYDGLAEIQRCDDCDRYECDDDAAEAAKVEGVEVVWLDLRGFPAAFAKPPARVQESA